MHSETAPASSAPQSPRLNITPIRVTTILFAISAFLAPLAFFIGAFNDTGKHPVSIMSITVLVLAFLFAISHVITVIAITSPHRKLNGIIKATFITHVILGICVALLALCIAMFFLISAQASANPTEAPSSVVLFFLIGSVQLAATLSLLVLPIVAIIAVILSFMLVAKRPILSGTETPTPPATPPATT